MDGSRQHTATNIPWALTMYEKVGKDGTELGRVREVGHELN